MSPADIDTLVQMVRDRTCERVVPVIAFVFGGGPGTIQNVLENMAFNNPIIIASGSGRCADLIADWTLMHKQIAEFTKDGLRPWHLLETQNNLARAWILNPINGDYKIPQDKITETARNLHIDLEQRVKSIRATLDAIATYSQLHFFDIAAKERADGTKNELLPVVISAIFESPSIKHSVKLPLAIRYDNVEYVERIMSRQGAKMLQTHEMAIDSRLAMFAAFHDQAEVFEKLNEWGFDHRQMDNIILLELHQLAEIQLLSKAKVLEPPLGWIKAERHQKTYPVKEDQEEWLAKSTKLQVDQLKRDWRVLSFEAQSKIVGDDIQRVGWDKLPWLPGWTYRAVHFIGEVAPNFQRIETYLGQEFTLSRVDRDNQSLDISVVFRVGASIDGGRMTDGRTLRGKVLTSQEAERLVQKHLHESANDSWRDAFILGSSQWVALYDPSVPMKTPSLEPNVLLQQHVFDGVVGGLEIDEPGWWTPKKQAGKQRSMSKVLTKYAWEAFRPWLDVDNVKIGVPWWRTPRSTAKQQSSIHEQLYSSSLAGLQRLFWAIMTNRDKLAEVLWTMMPPRGVFAGAFLCGFAISKANLRNPRLAEPRARAWHEKTIKFLDELEKVSDPDCIRAVFDEYLYFGTEEEEYTREHPHEITVYGILSQEEKISDAKIRQGLLLMGCDVDGPKTRIDLAIIADSKEFLGHPATEHFMDELWTAPASVTQYSELMLQDTALASLSTPRMKFVSSTFGWLVFVFIFSTVFMDTSSSGEEHGHWSWSQTGAGYGLQVPTKMTEPSTVEMSFWIWTMMLLCNELYQLESADSFSDYISGSGNLLDATIQTVFGVALLCRVVSYVLFHQGSPDLAGIERCHSTYPSCDIYLVALALLAINYMACGFRILMSLQSNFKDVGVLLIIVQSIVLQDVAPFMVVLIIFIVCFSVSGYFFFLASDQPGTAEQSLSYLNTWLDVGLMQSLPDLLEQDEHLKTPFENWYRFPSRLHYAFMIIFFVLTSIILTNLLIAMMSDRFTKVTARANAEWRVVFSGQVREYTDATVLPLPFAIVEMALNTYYKAWFAREKYRFANNYDGAHEEKSLEKPAWGRHYTWPRPSSRFDLHYAVNHKDLTGKAITEEATRLGQIQAHLDRQLEKADKELLLKKSQQYDEKISLGGEHRQIQVAIIDKSAIETESHTLACELGVQGLWRVGWEHSYTGPGVPVHIGNIPTAMATEDAVLTAFRKFGSVLAATLRFRDSMRDGKPLLSWAIVSFTSTEGANVAVAKAATELGAPGLKVHVLDADQALASTGEMGRVMQLQFAKSEASSVRGDILCETSGVSETVGDRCVAVRLECDGRILIVRKSGVQPMEALLSGTESDNLHTKEQRLLMALASDDSVDGLTKGIVQSSPGTTTLLSTTNTNKPYVLKRVQTGTGLSPTGHRGRTVTSDLDLFEQETLRVTASNSTSMPNAFKPASQQEQEGDNKLRRYDSRDMMGLVPPSPGRSLSPEIGSDLPPPPTLTVGMLAHHSMRSAVRATLFVRRIGDQQQGLDRDADAAMETFRHTEESARAAYASPPIDYEYGDDDYLEPGTVPAVREVEAQQQEEGDSEEENEQTLQALMNEK